jgi:DNA-binding beta-propeller fold protein YncE
MYETNTNSQYADYGEVTSIINEKLINVNMGGERDVNGDLIILEAVAVEGNYIPKIGDWVTIEWRSGQPVAIGGNNSGMSNGLTNINEQVKIISQTDVASGVINSDHIRANAIEANHISANAVQAQHISANSIQSQHISAGSIQSAHISAGVIQAQHISAGSITTEAISANAVTSDKIAAGSITSEHISAGTVIAAEISANSITGDMIQANQISGNHIVAGSVTATHMKVGTITAESGIIADASIGTAHIISGSITSAKIGLAEIKTANIATGNITNALIADATITDAKIDNVDASKIKTGFLAAELISAGTIVGSMIAAQSIAGNHIAANSIDSNHIKSGAITATKIAANTITGDKIAAESISGDKIMVNSISAEHIVTRGLDAQLVNVYNSATGQVLIGGGYLRVDGMDVGVVQSDNLVANGLFLTASSSYGNKRMNPEGEALLGSNVYIPGGSQIWKIDSSNGTVISKIDITSKKPMDIAIDEDGTYAYATVDGDSTLVQIDLTNFTLTDKSLPMGMGPETIRYTGDALGDMKHFFILNSDPTDMMIPDSMIVIDAPPMSVNGDLYVHHQIPLGNGPYDFVIDTDKKVYITQWSQGDVAVLDASFGASMEWRVVANIPIAAFATDNYHGGLEAQFGLGEVLGGDASAAYNAGAGMAMAGMDMHDHGSYGSSDGSMKKYTPHGIALSSDSDTLFVTDFENGELVVVSKSGSAPYNTLTGRHDTSGNASGGTMGGMGMDMSGSQSPAMTAAMGEETGGGPTTKWVRYRIPVGQSPDRIEIVSGKIFISLQGSGKLAVIDEQDIIDAIEADRIFYMGWSNSMPMNPYPDIMVRTIDVGSKPGKMTVANSMLYVTLAGQNQIAVVDYTTETVVSRFGTGANPKGLAVSHDGAYIYVVNYGGSGELSFVYPRGAFIGDAYLGLEGMVEYQGGEYWTPDRSDWVFDVSGNVRTSSTVEFRINEPFLNEGGYVKLTAQGKDYQYTQIEQDIYNVTNYSNGDNVIDTVGEILIADSGNVNFYPKTTEWMDTPAPHNIKIVTEVSGNRMYETPDPSEYTIHYSGSSRIEFSGGVVPSGSWVQADYRARNNLYFKPHNGSILIAIENSSSPNYNTVFEVDEFVPKFVSVDNQMTEPFSPVADGISETYTGLWYSVMTNRAVDQTVTSSAAPTSGSLSLVVNGFEPDELHGDTTGDPVPASSGSATLPSGNQWVKVDLGATYMIGSISVAHSYGLDRTYHGTKTEISEDGVTWTTIYDSAVSGEYNEKPTYHSLHGHTHYAKFFNFNAKPVRYIRDWANGWTSGDGLTSGSTNDWTEIKAYGDWEVEYDYVYPDNSPNAGEQIATNGKCFVSTDIQGAYVYMDIQIEFTTWWYMTYIVGPQFGQLEVDMPTMGMSHSLFLDSPYINKVAHRHIMAFPPSVNVMADATQGTVAGKHRAVIRQLSGKVTIDRFRFEDFQYYARSSTLIPNTSSSYFTRYKIVAEQAKWFIGSGNQSTFGAYDEQRTNPDTHLPDHSVPIKYRVRVKSELNADGSQDERGTTYVTSAIFETGKLSTHWRPSAAQDSVAGTKIEMWDGNQPHKTGIQSHHLANGSVRGPKILPGAIMDYHISPYARIVESKLLLNYPTHGHSNKAVLDSILGFSGSGVSMYVAHADHNHDDRYLLGSGGSIGIINITGNGFISGNQIWHSGIFDPSQYLTTANAASTYLTTANAASVYATITTLTGNYLTSSQVSTNYLSLTGGVLSGSLVASGTVTVTNTENPTIRFNRSGAGFFDWEVVAKSGGGLYFMGNADGSGSSLTELFKIDGSGAYVTGSRVWHSGNFNPANYYTKSETYSQTQIDSKISTAGDIRAASANTFTNSNTFTNAGLAIKVQPSANVAGATKLVQVADYLANDIFVIDASGNVTVKGNLNVSGSTVYQQATTSSGNQTVIGSFTVSGNSNLGGTSTDTTTVNGSLVLTSGTVFKQIGLPTEVMRFTAFGNGGDMQFQIDSTTNTQIVRSLSTFDPSASCLPSTPAGANRTYKMLVHYSMQNSGSAVVNMTQTDGTILSVTRLPAFSGGVFDGSTRTFLSQPFQISYTGDTYLNAYTQIPNATTSAAALSGGSLTTGTWYYYVILKDEFGNRSGFNPPSFSFVVANATNKTAQISFKLDSSGVKSISSYGITGYEVWRSTGSGTETKVADVSGSYALPAVVTVVDDGTTVLGTASPPNTNPSTSPTNGVNQLVITKVDVIAYDNY